MKRYIVRAPQTDRFEILVPERCSELIDDCPPDPTPPGSFGKHLLVEMLAAPAAANPPYGPVNFDMSALTVLSNDGFTLPASGNVVVTVPETGVWQVAAQAWWRGVISSGTNDYTGLGLRTYLNDGSQGDLMAYSGTLRFINTGIGLQLLNGGIYVPAQPEIFSLRSLTASLSTFTPVWYVDADPDGVNDPDNASRNGLSIYLRLQLSRIG